MSIIVVIDDRVTNRRVLEKLATSIGDNVTVKAFAEPQAALEWSKSNVPDLVVTDFKMPKMDGAEFIRRFRELPPCIDVPVMVVTAYEDQAFRYAALESGATDFLLSPVDHHEFRARSRNLLSLREHQKLLNERAISLEHRYETDKSQLERALTESHERLLLVIDAVPAMISATTAGARYAFMNNYQAQLFGVIPDEAVGRTAMELLNNDYAQNSLRLDERAFATGEAPPLFEEEFVTVNNVKRIFLTSKSLVRDSEGQVTNIVTVSFDITERKAAEQQLIEAKELAEVANRSKTEFLANMSHELRTPLNAIIGYAQVIGTELLGPIGNEKYGDYARNIEESGSLLLHIIKDILDVSMIEAGTIELHEEAVDLAVLVDDVLRLAEERAAAAQIVIKTNIEADVPLLMVDPVKVKQILLNLLVNALKFTLKAGEVTIAVRKSEDGVEISVADNGVGMTEEEVKIAVTRFGRLRNSETQAVPGTGLGLPLSIDLTELHGGELQIASDKGIGTTIVVLFPHDRILEEPSDELSVGG